MKRISIDYSDTRNNNVEQPYQYHEFLDLILFDLLLPSIHSQANEQETHTISERM